MFRAAPEVSVLSSKSRPGISNLCLLIPYALQAATLKPWRSTVDRSTLWLQSPERHNLPVLNDELT